MTTREDLLRAICSDPFDSTGRLMFADFLEENGEAKRSEFIRVQCELEETVCSSACNLRAAGVRSNGCVCGRNELRRREKALLAEYWTKWLTLPHLDSDDDWIPGWDGQGNCQFRRGFVEVVSCRLADWIGETCDCLRGSPIGANTYCSACHGTGRIGGRGAAIVACQPVLEVRLHDTDVANTRPVIIRAESMQRFRELRRWEPGQSRHELRECISNTLIDHARRLAGLPELDWTNRTIKEEACVK